MEIVGSINPSSTLETVDNEIPAWRATCLRDSPAFNRKLLKITPISIGVAYMQPSMHYTWANDFARSSNCEDGAPPAHASASTARAYASHSNLMADLLPTFEWPFMRNADHLGEAKQNA
jgi:hypothetical protein